MLDSSLTTIELADILNITHSASDSTLHLKSKYNIVDILSCFSKFSLQPIDKLLFVWCEITRDVKRSDLILLLFCHENINIFTMATRLS